jgi:hypothetical protein
MPTFQKVFIESVFVGLFLIPVVYLAAFFTKLIVTKPTLPEICATWNENYIMEINLFIAGFLFHMICQYSGINEWYVKQYQ